MVYMDQPKAQFVALSSGDLGHPTELLALPNREQVQNKLGKGGILTKKINPHRMSFAKSRICLNAQKVDHAPHACSMHKFLSARVQKGVVFFFLEGLGGGAFLQAPLALAVSRRNKVCLSRATICKAPGLSR